MIKSNGGVFGRNPTFGTVTVDGAVTAGAASSVAGNLTLTGGNLVLSNGNGIDFSATANSSGTMTSELLNDYEEGTFTATWTGGTTNPTTPVTATFSYTKIGRMVHVRGHFNSVDTTGASGVVRITGLPFAASGDRQLMTMLGFNLDAPASSCGVVALVGVSTSTSFDLYSNVDNGGWATVTDAGGTTRFLAISGAYQI
jgi:filamentous hemagglutinin family protein